MKGKIAIKFRWYLKHKGEIIRVRRWNRIVFSGNTEEMHRITLEDGSFHIIFSDVIQETITEPTVYELLEYRRKGKHRKYADYNFKEVQNV